MTVWTEELIEARAEIERLTRERDELRAELDHEEALHKETWDYAKKLEAENARLRALVTPEQTTPRTYGALPSEGSTFGLSEQPRRPCSLHGHTRQNICEECQRLQADEQTASERSLTGEEEHLVMDALHASSKPVPDR